MRLRFDLLLFLAVNNIPFGVNGFTLAAGLPVLLWKHEATGLGFSMENNLEHLYGNGVCIVLFSSRVLGVAGESKSLRARTLLYGGLQAIDILEGDPPSPLGGILIPLEARKKIARYINCFLLLFKMKRSFK